MPLPKDSRVLIDGVLYYYDGSLFYRTRKDYEDKSRSCFFSLDSCLYYYIGPIDFTVHLYQKIKFYDVPEDCLIHGIVTELRPSGSIKIYTGEETLKIKQDDLDFVSCEPDSVAQVVAQNKTRIVREEMYYGDPTTMALVAFRKRASRIANSQTVPHLFNLTYSSVPFFNEFFEFITQLKANLTKFAEGTRFQLIVNISNHNTVIDLEKKHGTIRSCTLSAADVIAFEYVHSYLQEMFPRGKHYSFTRYHLTEDAPRFMQNSGHGCNVFAMQHASKLSKIKGDDLYRALAACANSDDRFSLASVLEQPEAAVVLAPLLASTQSIKMIKSFPLVVQETKVGKKAERFADYVAARSVKEGDRQVSKVIANKSAKVSALIANEFSKLTDSQFAAIRYFRSGMLQVTHPALLTLLADSRLWSAILQQVVNVCAYIDLFSTTADKAAGKLLQQSMQNYLVCTDKTLAFYEIMHKLLTLKFSAEVVTLLRDVLKLESRQDRELSTLLSKHTPSMDRLSMVCNFIRVYSDKPEEKTATTEMLSLIESFSTSATVQAKRVAFLTLINKVYLLIVAASDEIRFCLEHALGVAKPVEPICPSLADKSLDVLVAAIKNLTIAMPRECSWFGFFGVASRHSIVHDRMYAFADSMPLVDISREQQEFYKQLLIQQFNRYQAYLADTKGRSAKQLEHFVKSEIEALSASGSDVVTGTETTAGVSVQFAS